VNRTNLIIDFGVFVAFLVAFEPSLTGIAIHEWLSVALAVALIVHLILHWRWVTNVALKFFKQLFHTSRLKFVVDLVLYLAMITLMLSGLLISKSIMPLFGMRMSEGSIWRLLHSASANVSLIAMAIHFALNWNWVVSNVKRYVIDPAAGLFRRRSDKAEAGPDVSSTPAR